MKANQGRTEILRSTRAYFSLIFFLKPPPMLSTQMQVKTDFCVQFRYILCRFPCILISLEQADLHSCQAFPDLTEAL